jgi:hypothetical protein
MNNLFNIIKNTYRFYFGESEGITKIVLYIATIVSIHFNFQSIIKFTTDYSKLPAWASLLIGATITITLIKGVEVFTKDLLKEIAGGKEKIRLLTLGVLLAITGLGLIANSYNGGAVLGERKVAEVVLVGEERAEAIRKEIDKETYRYNSLINREDSLLMYLKNSWLTAPQRTQILANKETYIKEKSKRITALERKLEREIDYQAQENKARKDQHKKEIEAAGERGGATGGLAELIVFLCAIFLFGLQYRKINAPTLPKTEESESVNFHENTENLHNGNVKIDHTQKYMELSNAEFQKVYGKLFPFFEEEMNTYNVRLRTGLHANTIEKIRANWKQRGLAEENYQYIYKEGNLGGMKWTNPINGHNHINRE